MITFKELKDFVNKNDANLDNDSLFLIKKGNKFSFIREGFSYLNIDTFSFYKKGVKQFEGMVHGDVSTTWASTSGEYISGNSTGEGNLFNAMYNSVFERGALWMTKELFNDRDINEKSLMVSVGLELENTAFWTIDSIKMEKPVLKYNDSYGHEHNLEYKFNCIILELGSPLEREFDKPTKKVETKFEKFMENKKAQ